MTLPFATNQESLYTTICDQLDSHLLVPMKRQGLLTHYNGIDIIQTRDYITLHIGSYIRRIVESHGWSDMHKVALPMSADNEHVRLLRHGHAHRQTTMVAPLLNPTSVIAVVLANLSGP
jgi:hypothetical protein